ncbi:acetolactate synthase, partial [Klebsiella pneumoniae]
KYRGQSSLLCQLSETRQQNRAVINPCAKCNVMMSIVNGCFMEDMCTHS